MILTAISSGFKRSDLYSFNPNALDNGASKKASNKKSKAKLPQVTTPTDGQGSSARAQGSSARAQPAFYS